MKIKANKQKFKAKKKCPAQKQRKKKSQNETKVHKRKMKFIFCWPTTLGQELPWTLVDTPQEKADVPILNITILEHMPKNFNFNGY